MQFSLWRPKIYTCSPVGADITKLIPDPDILWAILMQKLFHSQLIDTRQ